MTDVARMRWGFVADDLTGACLVGGLLADAGVPTAVMTGPPEHPADPPDDPTAIVLGCNAESRVATPAESFERVRRARSWLDAQGCTHYFKFVDSTLRGHVGLELEAMLADAPDGRAVVVPGTPSARRTVVGGQLLCDGVPARSSPLAAHDVLSPLVSDRVAELFGHASMLRFAAIGEVMPGPDIGRSDRLAEAIERHLAAGTIPITDAADATAIERVLRTLVDRDLLPGIHVLCGSAGLATVWGAQLAAHRDAAAVAAARARAAAQPPPGSPLLVVCGSRSPTSLAQIARLQRTGVPVVPWDVEHAGADRAALAVAALASALDAHGVAVLVPGAGAKAAPDGDTRTPRAPGHDVDGVRAAAFGLVDTLAHVVATVMVRRPIKTLVLVGGMTAAAVLRSMHVHRLEPIEHHDFVVRSRARIGADPPLTIVTKGGSGGNEHVLERTVARLMAGRGLGEGS